MKDEIKDIEKEKKIKKKRKIALIVLAVLIVVSTAAELITNNGREGSVDVYIQIRCDSVAAAPEKLTDQSKLQYIPDDGEALARLKYIAEEGDSALKILEKICSNKNIEVKKNPEGTIESIGYLENGDCGEESGWVYTVNGKLMTGNPADYKVSEGDEIVWAFTLNGGRDIENI